MTTFTTTRGSFTRPNDTTPYTSGDLVGNSTSAGSVVPLELPDPGPGLISRLRVLKSATSITNAQFRVHLYARGSLTFANGDNAAISLNGAASYLGSFDTTLNITGTDSAAGVAVPISGQGPVPVEGKTIYAVLEARAGYTPTANEVFTVIAEVAN